MTGAMLCRMKQIRFMKLKFRSDLMYDIDSVYQIVGNSVTLKTTKDLPMQLVSMLSEVDNLI